MRNQHNSYRTGLPTSLSHLVFLGVTAQNTNYMFFVSFGKGVGKGKVCVGCYTQDEERESYHCLELLSSGSSCQRLSQVAPPIQPSQASIGRKHLDNECFYAGKHKNSHSLGP